mmetsp:Transcript_62515/g.204004  ORF Transcript_62515/g.204004 Transcript_62515/m.204004 type:complete len:507 (+) Transcript_62515:334-1854(+)
MPRWSLTSTESSSSSSTSSTSSSPAAAAAAPAPAAPPPPPPPPEPDASGGANIDVAPKLPRLRFATTLSSSACPSSPLLPRPCRPSHAATISAAAASAAEVKAAAASAAEPAGGLLFRASLREGEARLPAAEELSSEVPPCGSPCPSPDQFRPDHSLGVQPCQPELPPELPLLPPSPSGFQCPLASLRLPAEVRLSQASFSELSHRSLRHPPPSPFHSSSLRSEAAQPLCPVSSSSFSELSHRSLRHPPPSPFHSSSLRSEAAQPLRPLSSSCVVSSQPSLHCAPDQLDVPSLHLSSDRLHVASLLPATASSAAASADVQPSQASSSSSLLSWRSAASSASLRRATGQLSSTSSCVSSATRLARAGRGEEPPPSGSFRFAPCISLCRRKGGPLGGAGRAGVTLSSPRRLHADFGGGVAGGAGGLAGAGVEAKLSSGGTPDKLKSCRSSALRPSCLSWLKTRMPSARANFAARILLVFCLPTPTAWKSRPGTRASVKQSVKPSGPSW